MSVFESVGLRKYFTLAMEISESTCRPEKNKLKIKLNYYVELERVLLWKLSNKLLSKFGSFLSKTLD